MIRDVHQEYSTKKYRIPDPDPQHCGRIRNLRDSNVQAQVQRFDKKAQTRKKLA